MIKKLFVGLLVLGFLVLPAVSKAYTLTDAKKQIQSLTDEIASLKSQISAAVLKSVDSVSTPVSLSTSKVSTTSDCVINSFTATPTELVAGGIATLSWTTTGCGNAAVRLGNTNIDPLVLVSPNSTYATGPLTGSKVYILEATNLIPGCSWTSGYSAVSGQPCYTTTISANAAVAVKGTLSLPAGCTSTAGYSATTGQPCSPAVAGCSNTPSVAVVSPNGTEFYKPGSSIPAIQWKTCNISSSSSSLMAIDLVMTNTNGTTTTRTLNTSTVNDGAESVTLPTIATWPQMVYGNNFKIVVRQRVFLGTTAYQDQSDQNFTIAPSDLRVVMGQATIASNTNMAGQVTSATYNIPLTVTSYGGTKYIGQTAQFAATTTGTNAFSYALNASTAPATDIVAQPNGTTITSALSSSDASIEGQGFRLDDSATKHFTLTVMIQSNPAIGIPANYRVHVNDIRTFTNDMLTNGSIIQALLPYSSYQTAYAHIN